MKTKIIVREKIWIPSAAVNVGSLKEIYTTHRYEEQMCRKCEYRAERFNYQCETCEGYKGVIKLYALKTINGEPHIGLPVGAKAKFERHTGLLFSECRIVDRRTDAPFHTPIEFIATLRDYQVPVCEKFLKKKYGLICAPPRTGKTLLLLYCCLQLGQRTLILASQNEFLEQFIDHIRGNEKEGIPKCTNLPELEVKLKKKLYGFPKTDEDFETFQFFFMTPNQFYSEKNGKDRLRRISKIVGTVAADEVHRSAATEFAKVISYIPAKYRLGASATPERKDGLDFVVRATIGPIVASSDIEALTPTVILHKTEVVCKRSFPGRAGWVRAMQFLSKDEKRNALIVDWVMKDLANGHNIVIPVYYKNHVLLLQDMINKRYGKKICETFIGGGTVKNKEARKETLSRVKANKTRVIVGIRSLLQLGLNVPSWSCIYTCMPISNSPNLRQETSRVRTPMEGKRDPVIRLFFDAELGQSIGCARSSLKHLISFKYTFKNSEKQNKLRLEILGNTRQNDSDSGVGAFKSVRNKF